MASRPALQALADRLGILPGYTDVFGAHRETSDETREALLAAMGREAATEAAARGTLEQLDADDAARLLAPVRVLRRGARKGTARIRAHVGASGPVEWRLEVVEEGGRVHEAGSAATARRRVSVPLPAPLDPGYHTVRLTVSLRGDERQAEQLLVVAPDTCVRVSEVTGRRRAFGVTVNLYGVCSERNWGAGDLGDLTELGRWAGTIGAAFVGVNPLHALWNRDGAISPYAPVSRLFRNPLYLDVSAVPEVADASAVRERLASPELVEAAAGLRARDRVDYEGVMALKEPLLRALHREFVERHRDRRTERALAYREYVRSQGEPLERFATFLALARHLADSRSAPADWRRWPAPWRDPHAREVASFRRRYADEIDFHRWVQFELDRQLAAVAERIRGDGVEIGLYGDLALGSAGGGSDTWAFPGLFVQEASLGAPPDDYAAAGQVWELPPIDPRRLAEDRYRYWILLIRNALAHLGALRVDHVMGLFRQYWIPAGHPGTNGAYVRFPADDLLGILALESRRARAVIVGEDLGTVPAEVPAILKRRGMLSTRVLYFEREGDGGFRPARRYPAGSLVSATTHDHAPLASFWLGRDLALRRAAGAIASDQDLERAEERRAADRRALAARLVTDRILPGEPRTAAELCAAVHRFLARTPARLVGVSLDDLTGEVDPINLPGVAPDRYPSWSRRMRACLEQIPSDPGVRRTLRALRRRARR